MLLYAGYRVKLKKNTLFKTELKSTNKQFIKVAKPLFLYKYIFRRTWVDFSMFSNHYGVGLRDFHANWNLSRSKAVILMWRDASAASALITNKHNVKNSICYVLKEITL